MAQSRLVPFSKPDDLALPLASASDAALPHTDLEVGAEDEPRWAVWARQAAERVREKAAVAADQAQKVAAEGLERAKSVDWSEKVALVSERAKSVDWSEKVNRVQENVSSGFEVVKDKVSVASDVVKDKVSVASEHLQEGVAQRVERVKSVDWDEKKRGIREGLSNSFDTVSTSASSAIAVAQEHGQAGLERLQEHGQAGLEVTREYSRSSIESIQHSESFTMAKDKVSAAAGAAKGAVTNAGERVSGLQALAVSPATWAQFALVFGAGNFFLMMSLVQLPLLLIAPYKFAMSFTIGSILMMSSFIIFSGPKAFLRSMTQREKLPFSGLYIIGLIGTLWATLFMRSYIATAIFAPVQAVALLYFVASYVPGGKKIVNACCGMCGRSVRTFINV